MKSIRRFCRAGKRLVCIVGTLALTVALCLPAYAEDVPVGNDDAFADNTEALMDEAAVTGVDAGQEPASERIIASGHSAREIVAQMTLAQRIEQMIVPAFRQWTGADGQLHNVTELESDMADVLARYGFGGVILFSNNFATTAQTVTLTDALQKTATTAGNLPLIISTDQEGGSVVRLTSGTTLCGNMALAATGDTAAATTAAQLIGDELAALGINADYAPVLDVNDNPSNPVIGVRSFSDDPQIVSRFGTAFLSGLDANGTATTVKHFPGHGNTATDSHTGLPTVDKTLAELETCELIPFRAAVGAEVDMVMTAHIQFPRIETGLYESKKTHEYVNIPATLSKTIISDILRGQMGFDGVVSTDALNMNAIAEHFDSTDAAILAINAGVDILLMPVTMTSKDAAIADMDAYVRGIVDAAASGEVDEERITESAERIVQLKIDRGIITDTPDTRTLEQKIADAGGVVGSAEHHATERAITQRAVTVTQNVDYTLPLTPVGGQHVLLLGAFANELPSLRYGFERLQREGSVAADVTYETLAYTNGSNADAIAQAITRSDYVVCISELNDESELDPAKSWVSASVDTVITQTHEAGGRVVIMSIEKPYDAARYPDADGFVVAYASNGMAVDGSGNPIGTYGPNIPTALDVIFGAVAPKGTLPVNIRTLDANYRYTGTVLYPIGYGITSYDPPQPVPNPNPDDPKPVTDPVPTPAPSPVTDPSPDPKKLAAVGDGSVRWVMASVGAAVCAVAACAAVRSGSRAGDGKRRAA